MSQNKFKLIIFDLDGTLIDSKLDIMGSVNATLKSIGLPERSNLELLQYVGSGIEPLISKAIAAGGNGNLEQALALFRAHYLENLLVTTKPFPGVLKGLSAISSLRLSVLTNKSFLFSDKIVTGLRMDHFFEFIYGGDSFPKKKPNPIAVHKILKDTKASPASTLIVGDSPVDIETGKRAGIVTCGVSYGYKDPEELRNAGADYMRESFSEVIKLIQQGE